MSEDAMTSIFSQVKISEIVGHLRLNLSAAGSCGWANLFLGAIILVL